MTLLDAQENGRNLLNCKKCGQPLDDDTIRLWFKIYHCPPKVCGNCLVIALDNMSIEATGEPLFPENWQVIRKEEQP